MRIQQLDDARYRLYIGQILLVVDGGVGELREDQAESINDAGPSFTGLQQGLLGGLQHFLGGRWCGAKPIRATDGFL